MTVTPAPPRGTKASGRRLWRSVLAEFELDEHELVLLREAVRTVDVLDALAVVVAAEGPMVPGAGGRQRVHPALVESRQLKIALARLVAVLRLPAGAGLDAQPQRRVGVRGVYGVPAR